MKNTYIYIIMLFTVLISCDNKVDDVFNVTPEKRVTNLIRKCDSTLISSKYGWVTDYETDRGDKFRLYFSFLEGDKVNILSDFDNEETISQYGYNASQGPVLSFSTYSVLHKLADPIYKATPDEKRGKSFEGDYEFVIESVESDSIIFRGLKYQNKVVFRKATEDTKSKILERKENVYSFLNRILGMEKPFIVISKDGKNLLELKNNISNNYFFSTTWASISFIVISQDGDSYAKENMKVTEISDNTFSFEKDLIVEDEKINQFIWDRNKEQYVASNKNDVVIADSNLPFEIDADVIDNIGEISKSTKYSDDFLRDILLPVLNLLPEFTSFQLYNNYGNSFSEIDIYCAKGKPRWSGIELNKNTPFIISSERKDIFSLNTTGNFNGYWNPLSKTTEGKRLLDFFMGQDREFLVSSVSGGFRLIDIENPKYWIIFSS